MQPPGTPLSPPSKPPSPPKRRLAELPLDDDQQYFTLPEDPTTPARRRAPSTLLAPVGAPPPSTPNPAQLYDLNQAFLEETLDTSRPLIGGLTPMSELRAEYEKGSGMFVQQIDWLKNKGFGSLRRTRGDGDCFYRATAYAFVEKLLHSPDKQLDVASALSILEATKPALENVGFQPIVFEDFYDALYDLISNIIVPDNKGVLTSSRVLEAYQDPEVSNSIVMYLRMVASAQIRLSPDEFSPFLIHPETGEPMDPRSYCEQVVEVCGKEADQAEMTALCRGLQINIDVAYLTGQTKDGSVDFVQIRSGDEKASPLVLLYRPGHYDILIGPVSK